MLKLFLNVFFSLILSSFYFCSSQHSKAVAMLISYRLVNWASAHQHLKLFLLLPQNIKKAQPNSFFF